MSREKVIGSYLVRFIKKNQHQQFNLHNLKTGERLEFESWVALWFFLDQLLAAGQEANPSSCPPNQPEP